MVKDFWQVWIGWGTVVVIQSGSIYAKLVEGRRSCRLIRGLSVNFLGWILSVASNDLNFAESQLYMQVSDYEMKKKRRGKLYILKDETFCDVGKKFMPKTVVYLMMDTFYVHRLKIRIRIISVFDEHRRT